MSGGTGVQLPKMFPISAPVILCPLPYRTAASPCGRSKKTVLLCSVTVQISPDLRSGMSSRVCRPEWLMCLCVSCRQADSLSNRHRPVYRPEFLVFPPLNYTKYQFSIVMEIFYGSGKNAGRSYAGSLCRNRSSANAADRMSGAALPDVSGERVCISPVCCGRSTPYRCA